VGDVQVNVEFVAHKKGKGVSIDPLQEVLQNKSCVKMQDVEVKFFFACG